MSINWTKYSEELEKIKIARQQEILGEEQIQQFPPDDEIGFRHELITPEDAMQMINRTMRTANLDSNEKIVARRAGGFITWLVSMRETYRMNNNVHIDELIEEVKKDLGVMLNVSVSTKGWLVGQILSPTKKFSLFGERQEKRGLFRKKEAEHGQLR